jgi:S-methyl-5-thioribose-1-phosphate isomerase
VAYQTEFGHEPGESLSSEHNQVDDDLVLAGRSIAWCDGAIVAIDQRKLPGSYVVMRLTTVDEVIEAIATLAIRGAPAVGIAGALGVALSAWHRTSSGRMDVSAVEADARRLAAVRPTAVNLAWAVDRTVARVPEGSASVLSEALAILDEDERVNRAAAARAAELARHMCGRQRLRVLTHCNTGRLATATWGTALGAIRHLHAQGAVELVLVTETRPLLQGARLTTWELSEAGIPHALCVDAAAPAMIARGLVDCVVVGADRVAANGDVANKIGTYPLALAAARAAVPFIVVAPESTRDLLLPSGDGCLIEQRPSEEVTDYAGHRVAPLDTPVVNPAFDITPVELITAVVTEDAVLPGGRASAATATGASSDHG